MNIVDRMKKVCVVGLGYIGLPIACILTTHNYDVIGVDINEKIVNQVNKRKISIKERGLKELLEAAIKTNHFIAKASPEEADIFIICVPFNIDKKNKKGDTKNLVSASKSIIPYIKKNNLVILESTVTPGTTKNVLIPILEQSGLKANEDFYVAYCPERAFPGKLIREFIENDRLIGCSVEKACNLAKELYSSFVTGNIYFSDETTAELVKCMENTYRDVNIALVNEFSIICERLGVNVWKAIELANKHPRVNIHKPGPGVGGYCIQKDPWFIYEISPKDAKLIKLTRNINDSRPLHVVNKIKKILKDVKKPKVSIFGVAYKGNVNDVRDSPATEIIKLLIKNGYEVSVYDPYVKEYVFTLSTLEKSVKGSDCILIVTDHDEFKNLDPSKFNEMRNKIIFDTRNIIDRKKWLDSCFDVVLLGRD